MRATWKLVAEARSAREDHGDRRPEDLSGIHRGPPRRAKHLTSAFKSLYTMTPEQKNADTVFEKYTPQRANQG
jgi:hypothetical protein